MQFTIKKMCIRDSIETTMDIYAEATDVKKKEAIKALENNSDIF